jgi:hypothetical protein
MKITIGLARADYEQLLQNIMPEASAYTVLRKCPELARWSHERPLFKCVILECTEDEAIVLLEAAKEHCPQAVRDIEYGLKLSRAFNLIS